MHRQECVLANYPSFEDDAAEDLMDAVDSLAGLGFRFELNVDDALADGTVHMTWIEHNERLFLTFSAIPDVKVASFHVAGPKLSEVRSACAQLAKALDTVSVGELVDASKSGLMRRPEVLAKLGLLADRSDAAAIEAIERGLNSRFPNVRYHAAYAVSLMRLPTFIPELQRLLKGEPDANVSEMAEHALRMCDRNERQR